jgi:hypothetical protein
MVTAEEILKRCVDLPPGVHWTDDLIAENEDGLFQACMYAVDEAGYPLQAPDGAMYVGTFLVSDYENAEVLRLRALNAAETLLKFVESQRGSVP